MATTASLSKGTQQTIRGALELAKCIARLPTHSVSLDYDQEADVLYVSLRRPQKATDSLMLDEDGVLLSYRGKALVGITIFDASTR
jgi:uncharacterized protein YuzE